MDLKSSHAFFFNHKLKYVKQNLVYYEPPILGRDVWISHNVTILPRVKEIGHGAIIGAGAVISKDVPPYAVVIGNENKIVKYRFPKRIIDELIESKWWEKSIEDIAEDIGEYTRPYMALNKKTI